MAPPWPPPLAGSRLQAGKGNNNVMYYVYILKSPISSRHYIGHTSDLSQRLREHNSGKSRYTKAHTPWEIVYTETYTTKQDAYAREMQIKSYKGGRAFKALFSNDGGVA